MTAKTRNSTKKSVNIHEYSRESTFSIRDRLHIVLGSVAILFFIALGSIKCPLQEVFIGLAIFEFAMTVLYVCESSFLMMWHFQYQATAFGAPCFALVMTICNMINPKGTEALLDSFHFEKVKEFVQGNYIVWTTFIWILWTTRLLITHKYLVDRNTKSRLKKNYDMGNIKQSSIHVLLNCSAVILFSMLSYFSTPHQYMFITLAVVEFLMSISYVLMNQWTMLAHLIYQAVLFSVPISLNYTNIVHYFCPQFTLEFLASYGLTEISAFVSKNPFFVTSLLSISWSIRLMATHVFLLEVATDSKIRRRQQKRHEEHTALV